MPTVEEYIAEREALVAAWTAQGERISAWTKAAAAAEGAAVNALLRVPGDYAVAHAEDDHFVIDGPDAKRAFDGLGRFKEAAEVAPIRDEHVLLLKSGVLKEPGSPFLQRAGQWLGLLEDKDGLTPGRFHGPLTSLLVGGSLGAGLGYGASKIAPWFLPEGWDQKKLTRLLSIGGALAGSALPMAWMGTNMLGGNSPFDNSGGFLGKKSNDNGEIPRGVDPARLARGLWATSADPITCHMTMGAVLSAGKLPGGDGGLVTPEQMGRLAVGLGGGYLSGMTVGALLSYLTGMPPHLEEKLRDAGAWLGAVKAAVPMLYGI